MDSLAPYFASRTFEIRWPHNLVADELDRLLALGDSWQPVTNAPRPDREWHAQCDRFFHEVFTAPTALQEWELAQQPRRQPQDPWSTTADPWGQPEPDKPERLDERQWLHALREHVSNLPLQGARQPYWSERQREHHRQARLDLPTVARRLSDIVADLQSQGYLAWAFGEECVDGNWSGELGDEPAQAVHRLLGRDGIWPIWDHYTNYTIDDLCDIIELLADHVRRPQSANLHSYGSCGWHFSAFDPVRGLQVYRWRANELLSHSDLGLTLDECGRLETIAPNAVEDLVSATRSEATHVHAADADELTHALTQFRHRGATVLDRRQAVIALAGILERRRDLVKRELLRRDEGALFQLANEFSIRHQNANQRADYDQDLYLEWIFYWYLATINLTNRIVSNQQSETGSPHSAVV